VESELALITVSAHCGKTAVQMGVPDEREQLAAQLESAGWVKSLSWLRLVWLK
jgi:hypothetical protein